MVGVVRRSAVVGVAPAVYITSTRILSGLQSQWSRWRNHGLRALPPSISDICWNGDADQKAVGWMFGYLGTARQGTMQHGMAGWYLLNLSSLLFLWLMVVFLLNNISYDSHSLAPHRPVLWCTTHRELTRTIPSRLPLWPRDWLDSHHSFRPRLGLVGWGLWIISICINDLFLLFDHWCVG